MSAEAEKANECRTVGNAVKYQWLPRLLLREIREARGMQAVALARLLKIDPCRLYEYEAGVRFPSWGMIQQMAEALNLKTLGELVDPASKFGRSYRRTFTRRGK